MKHGIGLATAFRTLTIFSIWGKESASFVTSLYWFVPVGLTLGAISFLFIYLLVPFLSPLVISSLLVTLMIYSTRAFHLDGLGDMADGFGGGWTKERVLEIMKDPHIGAFGAISMTLLIVVKVAAIHSLIEASHYFSIIIIMAFSRFFLVFLATIAPYARKEGGTAHAIVGESKKRHLSVAFLQIVFIVFLLYRYEIVKNVIIFLSGLLVFIYIFIKGKKRIGGITGDMLGAACEISEALMLIVAIV